MAESSELVAGAQRVIEVVAMLVLGVVTGFVVIQAAIWFPVTWPVAGLLIAGLAIGACRTARTRPYFLTAAVTSVLGLGYGVALWVVLGGFG
jgi:hypothetical protein